MPMGLANSSCIFQHIMQSSMSDMFSIMVAYLDDILMSANDYKQHQERLRRVLSRVREKGLEPNPNKCPVDGRFIIWDIISPRKGLALSN